MVHVAETDSKNILFKFAKGYPELFGKHFIIEAGGHFGLEMPSLLIERIRRFGFKPICEQKIWGPIWPIEHYAITFDNEFKNKSKAIALVVWISKILSRNKYVKTIANCTLGPFSTILGWVTSLDSGQGMLLCYEKSNSLLK